MDPDLPALITPIGAEAMRAADVVIDFTVHPALLPALVSWLGQRGIDLVRVPVSGEDALPSYVAQPRRV